MKNTILSIIVGVMLSALCGCTDNKTEISASDSQLSQSANTYIQITQEEAKQIIDSVEEVIVLDVRRQDGVDGKDGADGINGKDGLSAYEIALNNGFGGTESEWLESLKGKDGKDNRDYNSSKAFDRKRI